MSAEQGSISSFFFLASLVVSLHLNISTKVIPQVISVVVLPNVSARSETVRETVKKSKASQVCHQRLANVSLQQWQ